MKVLTLTTIGTLAAVLAFSTGCSQSEIDTLNSDLNNAHNQITDIQSELAKAKTELNKAEPSEAGTCPTKPAYGAT